jgi:hypothetical protein
MAWNPADATFYSVLHSSHVNILIRLGPSLRQQVVAYVTNKGRDIVRVYSHGEQLFDVCVTADQLQIRREPMRQRRGTSKMRRG